MMLAKLILLVAILSIQRTAADVTYVHVPTGSSANDGRPCAASMLLARSELRERVRRRCARVITDNAGDTSPLSPAFDAVSGLTGVALVTAPLLVGTIELVRPRGERTAAPYAIFVLLAAALHVFVVSALIAQVYDEPLHNVSAVDPDEVIARQCSGLYFRVAAPLCGGGALVACVMGAGHLNVIGIGIAAWWTVCAASALCALRGESTGRIKRRRWYGTMGR